MGSMWVPRSLSVLLFPLRWRQDLFELKFTSLSIYKWDSWGEKDEKMVLVTQQQEIFGYQNEVSRTSTVISC